MRGVEYWRERALRAEANIAALSKRPTSSTVEIVYGRDFTNQSARRRQLAAQRIVDAAMGANRND